MIVGFVFWHIRSNYQLSIKGCLVTVTNNWATIKDRKVLYFSHFLEFQSLVICFHCVWTLWGMTSQLQEAAAKATNLMVARKQREKQMLRVRVDFQRHPCDPLLLVSPGSLNPYIFPTSYQYGDQTSHILSCGIFE